MSILPIYFPHVICSPKYGLSVVNSEPFRIGFFFLFAMQAYFLLDFVLETCTTKWKYFIDIKQRGMWGTFDIKLIILNAKKQFARFYESWILSQFTHPAWFLLWILVLKTARYPLLGQWILCRSKTVAGQKANIFARNKSLTLFLGN